MRRGWLSGVMAAGILWGLSLAPAAAADVEAGRSTFVANCAACHGETGDGQGPAAVAMDPRPRDLTHGEFAFDTDADGVKGSEADLRNVIRQGAAAYGGSPLMAPWGHLSEAQVADLVAFIRGLSH